MIYNDHHDKACQRLATSRWFSSGSPVSPTNKTDRHDITEILLKVALSTINLNLQSQPLLSNNLYYVTLIFNFPSQCIYIKLTCG